MSPPAEMTLSERLSPLIVLHPLVNEVICQHFVGLAIDDAQHAESAVLEDFAHVQADEGVRVPGACEQPRIAGFGVHVCEPALQLLQDKDARHRLESALSCTH